VFRLEEAPGLFPRLEDEGQPGQLGGAGADLQPVQIVPQDEGGNLGGRVAFLLVDQGEQVEGVGQHVPLPTAGSHRRISSGRVILRKSVSGSPSM